MSTHTFFSKRLLAVVMAFCVLSGAVSCINEKDKGEFELKVGESIPDFSVVMNDGSTLESSSLKSGVALIMFFNTGCPDCQKTLPAVQKVYEDFGESVSFAVISRAQEDSAVAPYWKENGYTLPYSPQADRKVYNMFATSRVPRVYICKDGIIKHIYTDSPIPQYSDLTKDINCCSSSI